jgi:hypothetical protein
MSHEKAKQPTRIEGQRSLKRERNLSNSEGKASRSQSAARGYLAFSVRAGSYRHILVPLNPQLRTANRLSQFRQQPTIGRIFSYGKHTSNTPSCKSKSAFFYRMPYLLVRSVSQTRGRLVGHLNQGQRMDRVNVASNEILPCNQTVVAKHPTPKGPIRSVVFYRPSVTDHEKQADSFLAPITHSVQRDSN